MPRRKISVLIVDDSAFMRKALRRMLKAEPMIKVVGEAGDGPEALEMVKQLKPDVVTLDVNMPGMDGIQVLKKIMSDNPTPVLMVSSMTSEGGKVTMRALGLGAVDFIDKSACQTSMDILDIAESLIQKIKVLAKVDLQKVVETSKPTYIPEESTLPTPSLPPIQPMSAVGDAKSFQLVAIAASTGGPMSLEKVLTPLPGDYPGAIVIVQHMPVGFTKSLSERMNQQCFMLVKEAEENDLIIPGAIYIAPAGHHLKLRRSRGGYYVFLDRNPSDTPHCPSADVMMNSVAETWSGRMLGIVLTGMGADGAKGAKAMKKRGATIIAQNEETCVVFGMPRATQMNGCVDRMVALDKIAEEIYRFK